MTLIYCDSFDHYSDVSTKWTFGGNGALTTGRNGSGLTFGYLAYPATPYQDMPANYATFICGFAYTKPAINTEDFFYVADVGTVHLTIRQDGSGHWQVTRNGTVLGTSSVVATVNTWYYLELKATIHDSAGAVELRVNGVPVIGPLTGLDTQNGAGAYVNRAGFLAHQGGGDGSPWVVDDFYFCDTSGAVANNFLGDIKVVALYPNGNGATSGMTGSDGNSTDNYALVDETSPNGDTDYVESSTVTTKDTYAFTNLTDTSAIIHGVQIAAYAKKSDAGARSIKLVARLSSTEEDSATDTAPGTAYDYALDARSTRPGGGQWTVSDVNSAEFGFKVTA